MKSLVRLCLLEAVALFVSSLTALAEDDKKADAKGHNCEVRMTGAKKFDQQDVEIQAGDTVTWINASAMQHSVTPDDDSELKIDEIVLTAGKFSDRVKFEKKGKFKYHCKFHAGMTGTITVK